MKNCKHNFIQINRFDNSANSPNLQQIQKECLNCEMIIQSDFFDGRKIPDTTILIKKGK